MSFNLDKHEASQTLTRPCSWLLRLPAALHTYIHVQTSIAKLGWNKSLFCYICTHTQTHTHAQSNTHKAPSCLYCFSRMQPVMRTATQEKPCVRGVITTAAVAAQWPLTPDSMGKWAHSAVRTPVGPVTPLSNG